MRFFYQQSKQGFNVKKIMHTSSKNEDTFIKVYRFLNDVKISSLKVEFNKDKGEVRINETYMFVDMAEEMGKLNNTIKSKTEKHNNFNKSQ